MAISRSAPQTMTGQAGAAFLVGAPRSGTSLLYKVLCLHPQTAWISNWVRRYPGVLPLAALNRIASLAPELRQRVWFGSDSNAYVYGRAREQWQRMFPMPVEGEPVFARCGIGDGGDEQAAAGGSEKANRLRASFAAVRRFGGGRLLVNKRIANNRRIGLLSSAFPDALFVEIVRDGRAVAYSLARVDWWPDSRLWWHSETPREWAARGGDPWELCARCWIEEAEATRGGLARVPPGRVLSISYEGFVADPLATLRKVAGFLGLDENRAWLGRLARLNYPNRNEGWRRALTADEVATIERIQSSELARYGYAL
jgi:hypothetical protein